MLLSELLQAALDAKAWDCATLARMLEESGMKGRVGARIWNWMHSKNGIRSDDVPLVAEVLGIPRLLLYEATVSGGGESLASDRVRPQRAGGRARRRAPPQGQQLRLPQGEKDAVAK